MREKQALHKRDVGHFLNPSFNRIKKRAYRNHLLCSPAQRAHRAALPLAVPLFDLCPASALCTSHSQQHRIYAPQKLPAKHWASCSTFFSRLPQSTKPCLLFSDDQSKSIYVVSFSVLDLTYFALCFGGNIRCMFAGISITNVWRGVNNRCTAVKGGHRFFFCFSQLRVRIKAYTASDTPMPVLNYQICPMVLESRTYISSYLIVSILISL